MIFWRQKVLKLWILPLKFPKIKKIRYVSVNSPTPELLSLTLTLIITRNLTLTVILTLNLAVNSGTDELTDKNRIFSLKSRRLIFRRNFSDGLKFRGRGLQNRWICVSLPVCVGIGASVCLSVCLCADELLGEHTQYESEHNASVGSLVHRSRADIIDLQTAPRVRGTSQWPHSQSISCITCRQYRTVPSAPLPFSLSKTKIGHNE